jgi:DNA-directed RNA polymerase beta' subunit
MSIYRELAYDRVVSRVKGIQFCVLSDAEIRRRSACEVTDNQAFQGNEPVPNGLFDTRMGVIDNTRVCATCHHRNTFCPGHFGHIVLARPVFYVQFYDIVRRLLRCVCFRCSKLLLDLERPDVRALLSRKMGRQKRWEAISKLCVNKVKRCGQETVDGCGAKQPEKVIKLDDMRIKMSWRETGTDVDLDVEEVVEVDVDAAVSEPETEPDEGVAAASRRSQTGGGGGTPLRTPMVTPRKTARAGTGPVTTREVVLSAEDVLRILRRISDAEAIALGFHPKFNRPEWMICTVMPVPPPAVRPSVRQDTGGRQEDDLTHKLADIVKYNNLLKQKIARGASVEAVERDLLMVQYHVATLIDNTMPSMYPSKDLKGRMFRSLCERLKHKEGRVRGNLMGKRVDFSARTVITPDPNLSIDELGVPLKIAMNLTFPEVVGPHNRDDLAVLVLRGPTAYPGAKHVRKTREGNRTIRLKGHPDLGAVAMALETGDVVERHLRNGDYVLFNRQPSLHKMSMMAHRVRVMEYNTFRLNVCVCASYNADFDGDEMNMHVPQSLQTHHEIRELAAVPLHVVSPRYSKPIITIVQDVALGVFRLTQSDVRVTQRQLFNLVASNPLLDASLLPPAREGAGPKGQWTGRQVLSTVLPPAVSAQMASGDRSRGDDGYVHDDDFVVIRNGVIEQGVLNTRVFSKESRGLVHATNNQLGPSAVTAMLNSTQKIICDWLVLSGFSVGVSDLVVSDSALGRKRTALAEAKRGVYEALQRVHAGAFENVSTKSDADFLEDQIKGLLDRGMATAGKSAAARLGAANNRMLNMIESGSKGKALNFTQMVACLGQQSIEQKRVPDGFDQRTLPHYCKFDDGPEARGFVEHSFIEGLDPHEFFFHSMGGRIGLIDTAVRSVTWDTPVVVLQGDQARHVRIGEWVDALLAAAAPSGKVQLFPQDRNMELLELSDLPDVSGMHVFVPTADADGRASWGRLTAVTRHDPGDRLFRVTTAAGRQVTVADSCSLLVWDAEAQRFMPTQSRDVKPGDLLPVCARLPAPPLMVDAIRVGEVCQVSCPTSGAAESVVDDTTQYDLSFDNGLLLARYMSAPYPCSRRAYLAELHSVLPGWSTQLVARFMDAFVGSSPEHMHVPDVAFNAHEPFVRGILRGYFWLDQYNVSSRRLTEGIAMLCARLGVQATPTASTISGGGGVDAPVHRVDLCAQGVARLRSMQVLAIDPSDEPQRPCAWQGDTVMDAVARIEVLGVEEHPKLYDVTVPSTLNFGIANGLVVRDTSETGYIQRKLIKAMEDCKIQHDLTVRNANGHIVQFLYGEDGMDAVKLEFQKLPYLSDSDTTPARMRDSFLLSAAAELRGHVRPELHAELEATEAQWLPRMRAHFKALLEDRRHVIMGLCGGLSDNLPLVYPVHVQRIVETTADLFATAGGGSALSDLDPCAVLDQIDALSKELRLFGADGEARRDGAAHWMPVLLRCFLSPKHLIRTHQLNRLGFARVVQMVRDTFFAAIAPPGDMVGIVAAQSLGEPATQLSQLGSSRVLVRTSDGHMHDGPIRDFVDRLLEQHSDRVVDLGGDSVVLDLGAPQDPDCFIVGVADDETTSWRRISQVSRHPANGGMVRVHTRSNRTTCATLTHSFLRRAPHGGVEPVKGSDLRVGDRVPVARAIPEAPQPLSTHSIGSTTTHALTREMGWLLGCMLAKHPQHVVDEDASEAGGVGSTLMGCAVSGGGLLSCADVDAFLRSCIMPDGWRRVPSWVFASNGDFIDGVLAGVFHSSGAVVHNTVRSHHACEGVADDIMLLLAYAGVFASKQTIEEPATSTATAPALPQYRHEVVVAGEYVQAFEKRIGFTVPCQKDALAAILAAAGATTSSTPTPETLDLVPQVHGLVQAVQAHVRVPADWLQEAPDAVGRQTLRDIVALLVLGRQDLLHSAEVTALLDGLLQAIHSDVVWDEIVAIDTLPDPLEPVYDFTVPGNDSFMVDCGLLVHNTLNTFHLSGVSTASTVTSGVPRMKELMSVSRNGIKTPAMLVRLRREWGTSMERAKEVMSKIQTTRFRDLVRASSVYYDPDDTNTVIAEDRDLMRFYNEFCALDVSNGGGADAARMAPWVLRFEFDRMKMLDLQVSMLDIEYVLRDWYDVSVHCILSDDNAARLVGRLRLKDPTGASGASGASGSSPPTAGGNSNSESDASDLLTDIKALEQSIMDNLVVKGVRGIEKAVLNRPSTGLKMYDPTTDAFVTNDEWCIATAGSNMVGVMCNEYVDHTRTTTNDVYEVYNVLGIEAARQVLIDELRSVLGDLPLDHRHLSLLADTMSNRGFFMSIDRHGINNRGELGPLSKASFEQTTDMLTKAGVFAERDRINGVSANIMLGQVAPCGTGDCEVLIDGERLARMAAPVDLDDVGPPADAPRAVLQRLAAARQLKQQLQLQTRPQNALTPGGTTNPASGTEARPPMAPMPAFSMPDDDVPGANAKTTGNNAAASSGQKPGGVMHQPAQLPPNTQVAVVADELELV